ncbi:MAG: enoyl-CoA hydratase/isomerase family protein [bacterium]|nr:enoyl-CoA hydratase/isomerase family protein [bacterium]MCP4966435.1 enoyl-CoA hydratase/isomerase family protein [bacterium]
MGAVATVTLNRPDRHNSLVPELLTDLWVALEDVAADPSIRAVVLGAEGRSFSTGGDVRGFFSAGDGLADYASETVGLLNRVILTMLQLPQPIVAAVHGVVTGGSIGLILGSDVVLMARDATITPWYCVVGFSPDGGWTAMLPDLIGTKRTSDILLRNRTIRADQAASWGIVSEVVDGGSTVAAAQAAAQDIAAMAPASVASTKRLLWRGHKEVAAGLEAEREAFVEQIITPEALQGMAAFLGRER